MSQRAGFYALQLNIYGERYTPAEIVPRKLMYFLSS